jgi:hypothetical protein
MAEGLIDGTAFAVDASLIAADANKQRSPAGSDDVDWEAIARTRRSVREYLASGLLAKNPPFVRRPIGSCLMEDRLAGVRVAKQSSA